VVYRILIFYVGALTVLLCLYPWDGLLASLNAAGDPYSSSPFVKIFALLGSDTAAHILNFVVLTAALSVFNSSVYSNSRMLFGLAEQGDAPRLFRRLNRRGVPVMGIALSALITLLCVLLNYLIPGQALELLMALAVAALVINWAMISLSHLRFRATKVREGVQLGFPAFWHPFANYLCLAWVGLLLVVMLQIPGINLSVYAIPLWLLVIWGGYRLKLALAARR
jgi:aromatic amino acid transport protein AroP